MTDLGFYLRPVADDLETDLGWLAERGITWLGTNSLPADDWVNIRRFAALQERFGMRHASLHSDVALLSPDGDDEQLRERHLAVLERARIWNAESVVVHFRSLQQAWKYGLWWDENAYIDSVGLEEYDRRMVAMLKWLCEAADKAGTSIALENVPVHFAYGYLVEDIEEIIRRVGAPNLGICLDSGHAHLSNRDVAAAVLATGGKLLATHFHDGFPSRAPRSGLGATDLHLVPGVGTINWPEVIRALRVVEYQGPIIFEAIRLPYEAPKQEAWELALRMWKSFEALAGKAAA